MVVKDDLNGYFWLEPTESVDSEHAASVIARWTRTFTAPDIWVSDQGPHFKPKALKHLAKTHLIRHNLTVAYTPCVNGTVESVMRSVVSAMRSMIAELKLGPQDWLSVLPAVASALNETSLDRLGRRPDGITRSPLEVMTVILNAKLFECYRHTAILLRQSRPHVLVQSSRLTNCKLT